MARLPHNTPSSHLHGAANRVPLFSNEAFSFCKPKKQGLPITYPKQKTVVSFSERANTWKLSDTAECATQPKLEYKQLSLEEETEHKAELASRARLEYYQVSLEEEIEHKSEVTFLQGFDERFSDEMGDTLRKPEADQDDFTNMAVEIGSAILKVDRANTAPQVGAHSSSKVPLKENMHQSLKERWQRRSKVSDASVENLFLDSTEEHANTAPQDGMHSSNKVPFKENMPRMLIDRWQSHRKGSDASVENPFLDSTEGESGSRMNSEPSSSWSEEGDPPRVERREQASRSKVNVSNSPSAVVLKKPITVSRPMFEKDDPPGTLSDDNEDSHAGVTSKDSSSVDLTTGLKALRRLIFRKHFDLAKDLAKELYAHYPSDTDVLMEYAFVERQRGDLVAAGALYSQAIHAYEAQKNLGYDYVRALQALGSIEAHARNARKARVLFMESIRAARQAERLFPGMVSGASVYGLHAWARLEEKLGNWSKARELLARAAEIQPGNAVIHQSRALLEAKAHNWGAARHHFSLATEVAPNDLKCWHAWAIFEGSQGKHQKMRSLFQRALEVDPRSVHCLQAWAHQETLIGTSESKEKARSLFERCIKIEPKSLYSWQAWAVTESASGNYDKARELFGKCLEINPSSVPCLQAFATMERNLENWCSAQRLLRKALKIEPENAAVLMEAAFVEKGLGNMEVAEELFVLAGMADKRKTRVKNKMFASRKEVMPHKAGFKLWRAFERKDVKKSKSENNFKVIIEGIKDKQKELESGTNVNTDKPPSPQLKLEERGHNEQQVWVPTRSGA